MLDYGYVVSHTCKALALSGDDRKQTNIGRRLVNVMESLGEERLDREVREGHWGRDLGEMKTEPAK